ncbi:MAG: hypothetical protein QMD13_09405 [Candidatus Bathyarchaeia archaeon]|nr:hypothetical protein [Candidatus Bathyarchaeia archaeon]
MAPLTYLKIDYDLPFTLIPNWVKQAKVCTAEHILSLYNIKMETYSFTQSKNGNTHLTIWIKDEIPDETKAWLQWIIGDDCGRTYYNLKRIKKGIKNWNMLNRVHR